MTALDENLLSVEAMMDDEDGTITDYINQNQGIHLWWD